MDSIKQIKEYVYSELSSLESKDKHNRDLMKQKTEQLYQLLELVETLENELTKYEIMKNTHLKLSYIETVEYPL